MIEQKDLETINRLMQSRSYSLVREPSIEQSNALVSDLLPTLEFRFERSRGLREKDIDGLEEFIESLKSLEESTELHIWNIEDDAHFFRIAMLKNKGICVGLYKVKKRAHHLIWKVDESNKLIFIEPRERGNPQHEQEVHRARKEFDLSQENKALLFKFYQDIKATAHMVQALQTSSKKKAPQIIMDALPENLEILKRSMDHERIEHRLLAQYFIKEVWNIKWGTSLD